MGKPVPRSELEAAAYQLAGEKLASVLLEGKTITLGEQTIQWVEKAVENYDPLNASTAENTPEKLACWAIHCLLQRDPYDRLAETLELFHLSDDELPGMWSRSDFTGGAE